MNTDANGMVENISLSDEVAYLKTFVVRRDWLDRIDAAVIRWVNEAINPSLQSQTSFCLFWWERNSTSVLVCLFIETKFKHAK